MTRDELKLRIALTLYTCEKRRGERLQEALQDRFPGIKSIAMEPWVEVRDIYLDDAEEVLLVIEEQK